MKKTVMFMALAMGLAAATGCSNQKVNMSVADKPDAVYTGVLPAADADGVRYTLKLDYDDDKGNLAGDYDLVEVYLKADTTMKAGARDTNTFKSEGDFTIDEGTGANAGKKYLKLTSDRKDSSAGSVTGPLFFLIDNDSTLTLVGADLTPSVNPGLNYTLKKVN